MARVDVNNKTQIWTKPEMSGIVMMHADFRTHSFSPHFHDDYVIAVTENGAAEYTNKGISRYAQQDTILIFNPGEPHSGRMGRSDRWRYRSFYIRPNVFEQLFADINDGNERRTYFNESKFKNSKLAKAFLTAHSQSEVSGTALALQESFLIAISTLLRDYSDTIVSSNEVGREENIVSNIREYLHEHYTDDVSLKDLAILSDMSTFHLIRCFNKTVGLPPHAYLTQVRLRAARQLLIKGIAPVDVAVDVGFYDQSALTHHFKRAYGATPRQFAEAISADR